VPVSEYPVFQLQLESSERIEELGSKAKFWVRLPDDSAWLFKFGRAETGENWAEKLGAEVAGLLGLPHAHVELATFENKHGSVSRSFLPTEGTELVHGNEILAGHIIGYDASKRFRQSDHTFPRIVRALYDLFPEGAVRTEALTTFAGYLTLDAIICNVDRHHENWAILRSVPPAPPSLRLAPTFDHASSLGRELLDERRQRLIQSKRIGDYVRKGEGGIYWKETDPHGENPLEICLSAAAVHRTYFDRWIDRVKTIEDEELDLLVQKVPGDWMSQIAKNFALAMMRFTVEQLRQL